MHVILPKTFVQPESIIGPLFFFMGPVRGGEDWQHLCYRKILAKINHFTAVIPIPYLDDHPLRSVQLAGDGKYFERQLPWERYYLEAAAIRGCILTWLPKESATEPRVRGPYAQDTYGELGEWRGRLMANPDLRIVIGSQEEFPGLDTIRRNYTLALKRDFPFHSSLDEVVDAALRMVKATTATTA